MPDQPKKHEIDRIASNSPPAVREAELVHTAERLERACGPRSPDRRARHPDREAILRVLEDCPDELVELRATLLQEHVWRKREELG